MSELSLADFQLPLRPGHGIKGTEIYLRTNYFRMTVDDEKTLFKYSFTLTAKYKASPKDTKKKAPAIPPGRSRKLRQALTLLFEHPDFRMEGLGVATDYASTIITSKQLPTAGNETKEYEVVYREVEDQEPASNPLIYTFKFSFGGLVPTDELLRYLGSTPADSSDFTGKDDTIQALNIIVARTPNLNPGVFQSGTNKFFDYPTDPGEYNELGNGLIAVRGYYSSVRTSTLRTLLNVNAQTSPFYKAIRVLDLMIEHGRQDHLSLEHFLYLLRVKTSYMKDNESAKVKTIAGLWQKWDVVLDDKGKVVVKKDREGTQAEVLMRRDLDAGPKNAKEVSFECKEFGNKVLTIEQYFRKKYNVTLDAPKAWLLNCGSRQNPVWIPPQLCEVMPGQAFRGALNEYQTSQMIQVAARPPGENARRIANGADKVLKFQGNKPSLAAFGVRVDSKMVLVKGRVLEAPPLTLGGSKVHPTEASWNMRGRTCAKAVKVVNWSYLRLGVAKFDSIKLETFREALRACGLGKENPVKPQGFYAPLPKSADACDSEILKIFTDMSLKKVKIVLVVLPAANKLLYARVKYCGDVKTGIHSVCVLEENLKKGQNYYANVALKFNLKMGGVNELLPGQLGFLNQGTTMVVGIDVSHPPPKSIEGTPSIAAVVASIDNEYGQWPGSVRCQGSKDAKQEMVSTLQVMTEERLEAWIKKNGRGPAKILIYRDGVSEGQYKTVLDEELGRIREACKEIYGANALPQITIVVVGKRHHTRFYPTKAANADHRGNPKNGTVVDRGVTMERGCEYLCFASPFTSRRRGASDLCYGLASVFATLDCEKKC